MFLTYEIRKLERLVAAEVKAAQASQTLADPARQQRLS